MAFINDRIFDNGLIILSTEADRLDICSTEPATFADATGASSLGNKTALSVGSPQNGAVTGRRVVVAAISDGTVTGTGTAAYWAITGAGRLLATGALSGPQAVTSGTLFTLAEFSITIPDAA